MQPIRTHAVPAAGGAARYRMGREPRRRFPIVRGPVLVSHRRRIQLRWIDNVQAGHVDADEGSAHRFEGGAAEDVDAPVAAEPVFDLAGAEPVTAERSAVFQKFEHLGRHVRLPDPYLAAIAAVAAQCRGEPWPGPPLG